MLRSSAAPTTPTKRPLTELLTTSKRTTEDVIAKKRKLSTTPPQSERSQDKENRDIGEVTSESVMKVELPEELASNTLPSPLTTPTKLSKTNDASPSPLTTIPHIFAHAHLVLSTSSPLTSSLPLSGRSDQRDTLLAFLNRRFPSVYAEASSDSSTSSTPKTNPRGPGPAALYASGPPGIGKTALLSSVLGDFTMKVEEKEIGEEVKVCMRNCSTIGTGETAWERLGTGLGMNWKQGGGSKLKGKEMFEEGLKDGKKYLLILDEIDHLCTSTSTSSPSRTSAPDLLNALFSLASIPSSPLTLIGIANDLTLKALNLSSIPSPSKLLGKGKAKLDPLTTPTKPINLHFAPYSWQELVKIVHQRIELLSPSYPIEFDQALSAVSPPSTALPKSFPLIDKVALERAAKKVATGTGDVRTILDLVRKSISLVSSSLSSSSDLSSLTLEDAPKVKMSHMTQALTTSTGLTTAPSLASRLSSLNSNHRFVLVSLLISISRILPLGLDTTDSSSKAAITLEDAYKVYREVVGREESLKTVLHNSKDTFGEAVEMVEDLGGFFRVSSSKGGGGSPAKGGGGGGARKTPSPVKGRKGGGKITSTMIISISDSAPVHELVKVLLPSTTEVQGKEKEDETSRLSRKMLEREMSDQQWKRKLVAMGRDEERRAEEELEGREWERSMKAKAAERGERCD